LVVLAWPAFGIGSAAASPVDGTWIIDDLGLDLFDCQDLVCGRIVSIKDPNRRPTQCGRVIIWGLAVVGASEWTGGSILDPDDDATFRLSAKLQPDGALRAGIYKGVQLLGRTKILTRIDLGSLAGRCCLLLMPNRLMLPGWLRGALVRTQAVRPATNRPRVRAVSAG
jgi:uncharacterized protein (DUF2147 family)